MLARLPEVFGVAEARNEIAHMLEGVDKGSAFIIKGPKGREALMISADAFRKFQDAYMELVGELETMRILEDERAVRALAEASEGEDRWQSRYTLDLVERMVEGEEEGFEGRERADEEEARRQRDRG